MKPLIFVPRYYHRRVRQIYVQQNAQPAHSLTTLLDARCSLPLGIAATNLNWMSVELHAYQLLLIWVSSAEIAYSNWRVETHHYAKVLNTICIFQSDIK